MSRAAPRLALITGASSGIGESFARRLAAGGCGLVLVARRGDRLDQLAGELASRYAVPTETLVADLTEGADLQRVEEYISDSQSLDLLVNNAGYAFSGSFAKSTIEKHQRMIQLHVIASVRLTHAAISGMIARKQGGIINVSSVAAFVPWGNVTYNSTKAYLVTFSQSLHAEVQHKGVCVQALCPGFTITEFHDSPELSRIRSLPLPRSFWLSSDYVVQESLKALANGKGMCIPGLHYRFIVALGRSSLISPLIRSLAVRRRRKSPI